MKRESAAVMADSLGGLAEIYRRRGQYAEAEPLYRRALTIRESVLGREHPEVATNLENYAALLRKTSRATEAAGLEARPQAIRAKRA